MAEYTTVNSVREKTTDLMLDKIHEQAKEIADLRMTLGLYMKLASQKEKEEA